MNTVTHTLISGLTFTFLVACSTVKPALTDIQQDKITLPLNINPPEASKENVARSKDVFCLLEKAHTSCGLNPVTFQETVKELQSISNGTDFAPLINRYTTAARLCHDAKAKPSKYSKAESTEDSKSRRVTVTPRIEVKVNPAQQNMEGSIQIPVTYDTSTRKSSSLVETIELSEHFLISPEHLTQLQTLEDLAYCETIRVLNVGGFTRYRLKDFAGTWQCYFTSIGTITFELKHDRTMTGTLTTPCNDPRYLLGNYCTGEWDYTDGGLTIKMLKAGNKYFPLLLKPCETVWLEGAVKYVGKDEIILEDNEKLVRVHSVE